MKRLVFVGPGRIGEAVRASFESEDYTITVLSRREYGDFLSPTFAPEAAVATLTACDAVIFFAGLFELNAPEARMEQANCGAIRRLAEAIHARFPQAQVITFLDARIHRTLESLPEAVRAYVKSKQALARWTLEAASDWGKSMGTRVNAIAPGPVLPPPNKQHSEKAGDCLTPRPTPADIAAALKFLLHTPSVTGQVLYVAAGQQLL